MIGARLEWTALEAFLPETQDAEFRRSALASSFVATLELARLGKVALRQKDVFSTALREGGMRELDDALRAVEATLFAAEEPMSAADIALHVGAGVDVAAALAELQGHYAGRGVELVERGGRWHFQTAADLAHILRREREESRRLSRAAVETLAIIAYHEPVSRAEIEAIRGVQISKGTLDVLMEAGWVRPAGRREVPGRPLTYRDDAGLPHPFRAGEPPRPARARRSQGRGAARSGRYRARTARPRCPRKRAMTRSNWKLTPKTPRFRLRHWENFQMGGFSIWHWLIVGLVILLLFGKGRFSDMMGDVAKGLKSFKKGMSEDEEAEERRRLTAERTVEAQPVPPPPRRPSRRRLRPPTPTDRPKPDQPPEGAPCSGSIPANSWSSRWSPWW